MSSLLLHNFTDVSDSESNVYSSALKLVGSIYLQANVVT